MHVSASATVRHRVAELEQLLFERCLGLIAVGILDLVPSPGVFLLVHVQDVGPNLVVLLGDSPFSKVVNVVVAAFFFAIPLRLVQQRVVTLEVELVLLVILLEDYGRPVSIETFQNLGRVDVDWPQSN